MGLHFTLSSAVSRNVMGYGGGEGELFSLWFGVFVETHTIFHKKQREQRLHSALPFLPYRIANPRKAWDTAREKCKIYPYTPKGE